MRLDLKWIYQTKSKIPYGVAGEKKSISSYKEDSKSQLKEGFNDLQSKDLTVFSQILKLNLLISSLIRLCFGLLYSNVTT